MKVLQVIPSLSPRLGGPTQAVLNISRNLQKVGADVHILTTDDDTDTCLDIPLNKVISYQDVPTTFLPRTLRAKEFIYSNALSRWHRQHLASFDLIHTHYLFSYLPSWTARAARRRGIPYIMRPLGQLTAWALAQSARKKRLYAALLERQNLHQAAAIHCTSEAETIDVHDFGIKAPTVPLPLGVNESATICNAKEKLRQTYQISQNVPVILFLSRLHYKKQPEILLTAVSQLLKKKACHVIFAGTGEPPYLKTLYDLAASLSIKNHVTFAGFVSGYSKELLLQGADVFALPSHSENFGIAVAEALVSRLPVVITPGIQISPEIKAAEAGLVVEPDAIAFSNALYSIITQPHLSSQLSKNGLYLAKTRYAWSAIAQEIFSIYENILAGKQPLSTDISL